MVSSVVPKKPDCGFPAACQAPINRALSCGSASRKPVPSVPNISDGSVELSPSEISARLPPTRGSGGVKRLR